MTASTTGERVQEQAEGAIHLERDGGVAVITLDRPHKRNALGPGMPERILAICDEIDGDPSIGAAVVRGTGDAFCAGADRAVLDQAGEDPTRADLFELLGSVYRAFMRVGSLAVPVIAAVRGAAVGAGVNLVLAADLRIVAEDARLLAGFQRIGLHPGGGNFKLTARLAGREATAALSLFGEEIDGRRAVDLGLAWEALAADRVEPRALELAHRAAEDPELARTALRSFRQITDWGVGWDIAMEAERSAQMWSLRRRHDAKTTAATAETTTR